MRGYLLRSLESIKFRKKRLSFPRVIKSIEETGIQRVSRIKKQRENVGYDKLVVQKIGEYNTKNNENWIQIIDNSKSRSLESCWNSFDAIAGLDEYSHGQEFQIYRCKINFNFL